MPASNYSSPGINVTEIDKSLSVEAAGVTTIGTVLETSWGAAFKVTYVDTEESLIEQLGKPNENNAHYFTSVTDALTYTQNVALVRVVNVATAKNATLEKTKKGLLIENRDAFSLMGKNTKEGHKFAAKYPGYLGNSLKVSLADKGNFEHWEYAEYFSAPPGTSHHAEAQGSKNDELHVVIVDTTGLFTGSPNTVLETYEFLSKARDGRTLDLRANYWVNIINEQSKYVYVMDNPDTDLFDTTDPKAITEWGKLQKDNITGEPSNFKTLKMPEHGKDGTSAPSATNEHTGYGGTLAGGTIGDAADDSDFVRGWDLFRNAESTNAAVLFLGAVKDDYVVRLAQHVLDKVAEPRQDCVLVVSPRFKDLANKSTTDANAGLETFGKELNRYSSYLVKGTNWFLEYNRHTDETYWIPDNVGIAGLIARVDTTNEPWYSPGGYTRGVFRGGIQKTLWNPSRNDADKFYKWSFNRVTSERGTGVVLLGDRTGLTKPSMLRQIGVRRLLIQLRKIVANAAKYTLFEFNDSITQAQFRALVEPVLMQVQASRGLETFKVVCDDSNNTPQVKNEQRFVADIYLTPLNSINNIQLNFIITKSGVSFSEIGGAN
jgi:phage tail sheath protein|nr:MAG TPA: tail sheath protein [Caudoviricetes sp.]